MSRSWLGKTVYGLLLGVCIGGAVYFAQEKSERDALFGLDEVARLTTIIGRYMELPQNEMPIIATVTDTSGLDRRIFPGLVKDGDKLLIYRIQGKVILFRPSTEKVIDSSSLPSEVMFEGGTEASGQGKVAPTLSVYIATDEATWVAEIEEKLQREFPYLIVQDRKNATRRDYEGVVIYNPSFFQSELAERMAEVFAGVFEEVFPLGETVPNTDLLIIIGEPNTGTR